MPKDAPAPLVSFQSTIRRGGSKYASSPSWRPAANNQSRQQVLQPTTEHNSTDQTESSHTDRLFPTEVIVASTDHDENAEGAKPEYGKMHAISGLTTMPSKPVLVDYSNMKAVSGLTTKPSRPYVLEEREPVPQEHNQATPQEYNREDDENKNLIFFVSEYIFPPLIFLLIVAIIVIPVVMCAVLGRCSASGTNKNSNQRESASQATKTPVTQIAKDKSSSPLVQIALGNSTIEVPPYTLPQLEDPVSPQSEAVLWIVYNYPTEELETMDMWEKQQLFGLAALQFALEETRQWAPENRQQWRHASLPVCDWSTDIVCYEEPESDSPGRVRELRLNGFEKLITGSIPPELELLQWLETLEIQGSGLSGPLIDQLPAELSNIPTLRTLSFSDNRLMGEIPSELGLFTQLTSLALSRNLLTGEIPPELGLLTNLEELSLDDNQLSGRVPDLICDLTTENALTIRADCLEGVVCPENCDCVCS